MTRSNAADILCVGAQRSMTSWLHHLMSAHPDTWTFPNFSPLTSTTKEAHYWDRNHHLGAKWYKVVMRPLRDDLKSLDFTPEYAFLNQEQIAECKVLNPTAQVIYILRAPLARAMSALRMHTMWETDNASPDDHVIRYGPEFLARCARARLSEHGDYAQNLALWRKAYPDLCVVNYDDLAAEPLKTATDVFAHCDLDMDKMSADEREVFDQRVERINWPTLKYRFDADCLHFLEGLVAPKVAAVERELGIRFREEMALEEVTA